MKRYRIILVFVLLLVGFFLGFVAGMSLMQKNIEMAEGIHTALHISAEEEIAYEAYLSSPAEVGIYAMNRLIGELKSVDKGDVEPLFGKDVIKTDLAISYYRLGNLYGKLDEQTKVEQCHDQAIQYYRLSSGEDASLKELKQIAEAWDEQEKGGNSRLSEDESRLQAD